MQTRRFGKKVKLPATIAIKHQIRTLMLADAIEAERVEKAKANHLNRKQPMTEGPEAHRSASG